jgi:N-acyl-D-amino-acid deacylase
MLLQHTAGWDRDVTFDPMFRLQSAMDAFNGTEPASAETIIRYMLGQPLQYEPGVIYNYSNFGYAVLGRIIERVTGMQYDRYVHEEILDPAGAIGMRLGRSRLDDRAPGEVTYYANAGESLKQRMVPSVFAGEGKVPLAYGGFAMEVMDAHAGWVGSAIDVARFVTAVDGFPTRQDVLKPQSIAQIAAEPSPRPLPATAREYLVQLAGERLRYSIVQTETGHTALVRDLVQRGATVVPVRAPVLLFGSPIWYSGGWLVRQTPGGTNWWHDGSLPGTTSLAVRTYDGLVWVALFNARVPTAAFGDQLDQALWAAMRKVRAWPNGDLFARYR